MGSRTLKNTAVALKILKSKRARQIAGRALNNEKVRGLVVKQVSHRLLGK